MASSKSSPTASEEALAQREAEPTDTLAEQAKEERKTQAEEQKAGSKGLVDTASLGDTPADQHRSDHVQMRTRTSGDRPDQMTVNDPNTEPFYGHFVVVTGGDREGTYGVYVDNVSFDEATGKPDVVVVQARDESNEKFAVKYSDLAPAQSRGNAPR